MASYLVQAAYTSEALASLMKTQENRTEIVKKTAKKLGGKLSPRGCRLENTIW